MFRIEHAQDGKITRVSSHIGGGTSIVDIAPSGRVFIRLPENERRIRNLTVTASGYVSIGYEPGSLAGPVLDRAHVLAHYLPGHEANQPPQEVTAAWERYWGRAVDSERGANVKSG